MCLERMEICPEDVEDTSQRQAWCDSVLSVKMPVVETINKSFMGDKARVGEKMESILTQCGYVFRIFFGHSLTPNFPFIFQYVYSSYVIKNQQIKKLRN